jgi:hypothetical protein
MKSLVNNPKERRAGLEAEIHRVIEDGPGAGDVPPFQLMPKVERAIRTSAPVSEPTGVGAWVAAIWFKPALVTATAALVVVVGIFLFIGSLPENIKVESFDGNTIVYFDPDAPFQSEILDPESGRALHSGLDGFRDEGTDLSEELARALRNNLTSENWDSIRQALTTLGIETNATPPKHLVLSDALVAVLNSGETEAVDLRVIQPGNSTLFFKLAK